MSPSNVPRAELEQNINSLEKKRLFQSFSTAFTLLDSLELSVRDHKGSLEKSFRFPGRFGRFGAGCDEALFGGHELLPHDDAGNWSASCGPEPIPTGAEPRDTETLETLLFDPFGLKTWTESESTSRLFGLISRIFWRSSKFGTLREPHVANVTRFCYCVCFIFLCLIVGHLSKGFQTFQE